MFKNLGCFFAFNEKQFKEGIENAGGIEKTGKYVYVTSGLYAPAKNVKALLSGLDNIEQQWKKDRKPKEKIKLKLIGIDNWNRPIWKVPGKKEYYGSVDDLFSEEATKEEVLKTVNVYNLCYFGESLGCEPMGTDIPDCYYI